MKHLRFILLFIPFILFAQDDVESYDPLSIRIGLKPYHTGNTSMDFEIQQPIVLNVFFHYPNTTPGNLTEDHFLSAIAYLNINFNRFNIFFKYRGFDTSITVLDDMINITVTDDGNSQPHGNTFNMRSITLPFQVFQNSNTHFKSLIAHEVGHLCGLYHTFHGTDSTTKYFDIPLYCTEAIEEGDFPSYSHSSRRGFTENITRIATNSNYNAHVAGDFVVDTPATYKYPNVCNDIQNGTSFYLESNEVKDSTDTVYETIDTYNFMSYNDPHFLKQFTDGQGIRMRESLENEVGYQNIKTTVASLYQPYKINQLYPKQYFFQPGFDYEFVNCGSDLQFGNYYDCFVPVEYSNTTFYFNLNTSTNYSFDKHYTPYDDIYQKNHTAVLISQLNNNQPRRCYSESIEAPNGGDVIKFNDEIINTNFLIITLNSIDINKSQLINNLNKGLYIIKKNYGDGTQEQQTILKGDD